MPGPRVNGLNEAVGRALRKARKTSLEARGEETLLHGGRNLATVLPIVTQDTENSLTPIRVPLRKLRGRI